MINEAASAELENRLQRIVRDAAATMVLIGKLSDAGLLDGEEFAAFAAQQLATVDASAEVLRLVVRHYDGGLKSTLKTLVTVEKLFGGVSKPHDAELQQVMEDFQAEAEALATAA